MNEIDLLVEYDKTFPKNRMGLPYRNYDIQPFKNFFWFFITNSFFLFISLFFEPMKMDFLYLFLFLILIKSSLVMISYPVLQYFKNIKEKPLLKSEDFLFFSVTFFLIINFVILFETIAFLPYSKNLLFNFILNLFTLVFVSGFWLKAIKEKKELFGENKEKNKNIKNEILKKYSNNINLLRYAYLVSKEKSLTNSFKFIEELYTREVKKRGFKNINNYEISLIQTKINNTKNLSTIINN